MDITPNKLFRLASQPNDVFEFAGDGSEDEHIPEGAVALTDAEAAAYRNPPAIALTPEQQAAQYVQATQNMLDALARSWGYDDAKSAVTYADEPAVPKFQHEGQAIRAWRSLVWAELYTLQAQVQAGTRPVPTSVELIALLPAAPVRPV
jgi:hypothetical protein